MKTWVKAAVVTAVAVTVPAFFLGPVLFPPSEIGVKPTAAQMPFFVSLAVGDALLLGLGVLFLLFGLAAMCEYSWMYFTLSTALARSPDRIESQLEKNSPAVTTSVTTSYRAEEQGARASRARRLDRKL